MGTTGPYDNDHADNPEFDDPPDQSTMWRIVPLPADSYHFYRETDGAFWFMNEQGEILTVPKHG